MNEYFTVPCASPQGRRFQVRPVMPRFSNFLEYVHPCVIETAGRCSGTDGSSENGPDVTNRLESKSGFPQIARIPV